MAENAATALSEVEMLRRNTNYLLAVSGDSAAQATAGIATATVTSQIKTVTSVPWRLGGAYQTNLAGTDNFYTNALLLAAFKAANQQLGVMPASSFVRFYVGITTASAAKVVATVVSSTSAGAVFNPLVTPDTMAIIGSALVATDATHTFTPGTTLLGAAGITTTYFQGVDPAGFGPFVVPQTNLTQAVPATIGAIPISMPTP
jgi:hypothetical protein